MKEHPPNIPFSHNPCSATETEHAVLSIFARILKRTADKIDIRESLFNIGGHSLMATMVVSTIHREFGVAVSMPFFFLNPSVRAVAANIDMLKRTTLAEIVATTGEYDLGRETIVANADSHGPTLFIFPESTGFAAAYSSFIPHISRKVVAFGDDRWGHPILEDETLETIAANGVAKILAHEPNGPYYISGWSLGGYVALNAAMQLEAAGKAVSLVLLFDSSFTAGQIGRDEWSSDLDPLLEVINDKGLWLTQLNRANTFVSQFSLAPGDYTGKVVLIKATRPSRSFSDEYFDDAYSGWSGALPHIEVHPFDSTHRTMFNTENGRKMGKLITSILREHERRIE